MFRTSNYNLISSYYILLMDFTRWLTKRAHITCKEKMTDEIYLLKYRKQVLLEQSWRSRSIGKLLRVHGSWKPQFVSDRLRQFFFGSFAFTLLARTQHIFSEQSKVGFITRNILWIIINSHITWQIIFLCLDTIFRSWRNDPRHFRFIFQFAIQSL